MRFLPTTGQVMVNDVFGHLTGGGPITSPLIWECTRYCLSRDAQPKVAAALMLGGGEIMTGFGIRHFVGVFDRRMVRIYRAIGSEPEVLGSQGTGRDRISVGSGPLSRGAAARGRARRDFARTFAPLVRPRLRPRHATPDPDAGTDDGLRATGAARLPVPVSGAAQ